MQIGDIELTLRLAVADARHKNGELAAATHQYRQILEMNPNERSARILLGLTLASQQKWDEAIDHYQFVLRRFPEDAMVHYNLALALTTRGQLDEAIVHNRQAVKIDPDHGPAHYNLANLLGSMASSVWPSSTIVCP